MCLVCRVRRVCRVCDLTVHVRQDIPAEMDGWPWWEVKWNITSQYKFTIAIENSISLDYVTEKLFHSFIVGTVPSTPHLPVGELHLFFRLSYAQVMWCVSCVRVRVRHGVVRVVVA